MAKSKKAILVVGPPRSGTSAVANVISKLGVSFGDPAKFVDPEQQKHNPIFFELSSLNRINDEIFQYFSKNWSDFDWMPDKSDFSEIICSRFESAIRDFIENEFGNSESIGLKDPRFCYTLPLWETVLTSMGFNLIYVLVRRSASSVFLSNQVVNQRPASTNFRLVAQSHILAARFVQSQPFISVFYEELLRNPMVSIGEICKIADLPFDRINDASSVLNKNLRHHESEKPLFQYFSSVIDSRDIDPEEYDRYREIHLTSTYEKNKTIERLNIELAKIEQEAKEFPYRHEALKISFFLWRLANRLVPLNSRRRNFVKLIAASLVRLYRWIRERKYQNWIYKFEEISKSERLSLSQRIDSFERKPLVSVLMPVYAPPVEYLDEAINSVRAQLYTNWELCIADDASPNPVVRDLIKKHAKEDSRIHYVFRDSNGHISAASNSALELATGEFAALLDHDDILHPLALYYVVEEINAHPDVEVIYSDEDRWNEHGKRSIPYFKSEFDYDLLLRQNMVSHLGVYRIETIRNVGGFRLGVEGSQDYDLLLRAIEKIDTRQIRHIPHVLYHWRISNASAASGIDAKPYAYDAGLRAVRDHLARQKIDAFVEPAPGVDAYQVKYSIPHPHPDVNILIFAQDFTEKLEQCINSVLLNTSYKNFKVTIYLNSGDGIRKQTDNTAWIKDDRVSVIREDLEIGLSKIMNRAMLNSMADYVCLLDQNVHNFSANWLEQLVGQASQPGVGAVGPLLLRPDGRIFSSGIVLAPDDIAIYLFAGLQRHPSYFGWATIPKDFSVISVHCLLIKRAYLLDVGGFKEAISACQYANIDFCLRLREKGLRNIVTPMVELYVHQDTSYNRNAWETRNVSTSKIEDDQKFIRHHWKAWLERDPAFNPNLSIKNGRITLATSPRVKNLNSPSS
jgi:glycosyltransferase involved in cell wall biosynthesis